MAVKTEPGLQARLHQNRGCSDFAAASVWLVEKVDLSIHIKGRVPFLSPNEKGTKEVGTGGCIRVALPRAKCILPLCTPTRGALSKTIRNIQTCIVKAGRGLPKGAYLIAGAINSAPLRSRSFGSFLGESRKERITRG